MPLYEKLSTSNDETTTEHARLVPFGILTVQGVRGRTHPGKPDLCRSRGAVCRGAWCGASGGGAEVRGAGGRMVEGLRGPSVRFRAFDTMTV